MLEKIKETFDDIKNAIVEMGVDVDYCDSPTTYASKILQISREGSGNTLLFITVFKVADTKPSAPEAQMSATTPTEYPEG